MDILSYPIIPIALAVLIVLHAAAVILRGALGKVISYINILLHVAMLLPLSYYKIAIEEAVLVYLVSIFSYTLISTVHYGITVRRAAKTHDLCGGEDSGTKEGTEHTEAADGDVAPDAEHTEGGDLG